MTGRRRMRRRTLRVAATADGFVLLAPTSSNVGDQVRGPDGAMHTIAEILHTDALQKVPYSEQLMLDLGLPGTEQTAHD